MNVRSRTNPAANFPQVELKRSPRDFWRSYRDEFVSTHPGASPFRWAMKLAALPLKLRKVQYATFDDLGAIGFDVKTIDDGTPAFLPAPGEMPEHWKHVQESIAPQVATLHDALLHKDGAALLQNGYFCCYDNSFAFVDWRKHFSPAVLRYIDPSSRDALIRRFPFRKRVNGRCFSTGCNYPKNMGHFIHDTLSRIYYEDIGIIAPGREKIIAPRFYFPMQKFLFERIFSEYEIVHAPNWATISVEELLLPGNLCSETSINSAAISSLAERMRKIAEPYIGTQKRKICISRKDGGNLGTVGRDFVNIEAFETRMRDMGYDVVEISMLDPEDQLELWANTTDLVGIHGAGMMNMIFMPPGGNYTEISGAPVVPEAGSYCPHWTARCAMIAGHKVNGMVGDLDSNYHPTIDIERLEMILRLAC